MTLDTRRFAITILLALIAAATGGAVRQTDGRAVRVTDFGAGPGSRKNAVAAVKRALEACRRVRVEGNRVAEDVLGRNIVLKDTAAGEVSVGPNQTWIR
jgi:hypothetical protein